MNELFTPPVPLNVPIVNGLPEGARVLIEATTFSGAQRNFAVELYAGPNIAMHMNFRFGHMNEHAIVMNSMQEGGWRQEERHRIPIGLGQHFKLKIKNIDNKYKIKVNGEEFHFHHRIPPHFITGFCVKGDISIQRVHFKNFHEQCFQTCNNYGPTPTAPIYPQTGPGYNPPPPVGYGAGPAVPPYQPYGGAPPPPGPYVGAPPPPMGYGAYGPPPPHVIRVEETHHHYYHQQPRPRHRRPKERLPLLGPLGNIMDKAYRFL